MPATPNPVDVHVGQRLKQRRALMGLSQERLGELLGITFQQIQKYERGANRIGSSRLFDICRVLEVDASHFFEDAPTPLGLAASSSSPAGLAEDGVVFPFPDLPGAGRPDQFDRREALELVRAFNKIADPAVRRKLFHLTKALGALDYRGVDQADPGIA